MAFIMFILVSTTILISFAYLCKYVSTHNTSIDKSCRKLEDFLFWIGTIRCSKNKYIVRKNIGNFITEISKHKPPAYVTSPVAVVETGGFSFVINM